MGTTRRNFLLGAAGGTLGGLATTNAVFAQGVNSANAPAGVVVVPQRQIPVLAEADVVVCGGGTAGVSAACCAARHGAKVILLERWPSVGGMLTNALVTIWHLSDRKKQAIFGFPQDVIDRGGEWVHRIDGFPTRYETHWWEPEGARIVLHRMLHECGVRTICNLQVVESLATEGRITAVLANTKTGYQAVLGRIFIDATGDGDVAANAGVPFDYGRLGDGLVQGMTMMFSLRGIDEARAGKHTREQVAEWLDQMRMLRDVGKFAPFNEAHMRHYLSGGLRNLGEINMCPETANATDEEDLTAATVRSREHLVRYIEFWRRNVPGLEKVALAQSGFGIGVRESRRIRGLKTLDQDMVLGAVKQADAIGHGFWMIDIHDPKGSGTTTHSAQDPRQMLAPGRSYHIPLGMCLNAQIPNLAVVGRCASSTHEAHSSVRLQSHCMVMGQGIGTCAALALSAGTDMAQVDIARLQATLRQDGVYLEDVPG